MSSSHFNLNYCIYLGVSSNHHDAINGYSLGLSLCKIISPWQLALETNLLSKLFICINHVCKLLCLYHTLDSRALLFLRAYLKKRPPKGRKNYDVRRVGARIPRKIVATKKILSKKREKIIPGAG